MKPKKILAVLTAVIMALSLFACTDKKENSYAAAGEITVDKEMFTYLFNSYYRSFVSEHPDFVTSSGLDTEKPLSQQDLTSSTTWFAYILGLFKTELRETLLLANGAEKDNIKLSSEGEKEIEKAVKQAEKEAADVRMSLSEYLPWAYGEGVTEKTVKKALKLTVLAREYGEYISESQDISKEACEELYKRAPEKMLCFDCIKITVPPSYAERLTSAFDEEFFIRNVRDIICKLYFQDNITMHKDEVEKQTKLCYYTSQSINSDTELALWAKEEERQPFDIHTKTQSTGNITVTMILSSKEKKSPYSSVLYRDEETLKNAEYIFFEDKNEGISVYSKYKDSITEESFEELASRYGSQKAENLDRTTCPSDMLHFLFRNGVKVGDTELVSAAEGGVYIVRLAKNGDEVWLSTARDMLKEEGYDEKLAELSEEFPFTLNETAANTVEAVTFKS